jgi:hypothetical protein
LKSQQYCSDLLQACVGGEEEELRLLAGVAAIVMRVTATSGRLGRWLGESVRLTIRKEAENEQV